MCSRTSVDKSNADWRIHGQLVDKLRRTVGLMEKLWTKLRRIGGHVWDKA